MNENRHNDQNTSDAKSTEIVETEVVEKEAAAAEVETVSTEPAKIDSIAIALNEKDTINPELNLKDSIEETNEPKEIEAPDSASIVQSIGHQLKSARMARGLSVESVSRQLKISVPQIEAIEKEDFGKLPGRMFLRGFIRNYTNLLQLDPEPILKQLPQSQSRSANVVSDSNFQTRDMSFTSRKAWSSYEHKHNRGQSFFLKALLLLLMAMIIFAIFQSVNWSQLSVLTQENKIEVPLETGAETGHGMMELDLPLPPPAVFPSNDQGVSQLAPMVGIAPFENNVASTAESPALTDAVTNSADTESGVLHFRFRDESWVAIKDRDDRIIFEQLNAGGTEQIIDGKRPLSLVIGNADEVNLIYNDRAIDLTPYTDKIKGVARFTLE